jgi:hypothetical protein
MDPAGLDDDALMRHICIMRTTVTLPVYLYLEAKRVAAERRTSLTALLEEGLREVLARAREKPSKKKFKLPVMDGGGLREGIDITDTSELLEIE